MSEEMFARAVEAVDAWMTRPEARRFDDVEMPDAAAAGFAARPDRPVVVSYLSVALADPYCPDCVDPRARQGAS